MSEDAPTMPFWDRIRWWIYERCFAYCVRFVYPDANPSEFSLLDTTEFLAVEKDEIREIMEEAPEVAWRFTNRMEAET